jgi:hypothetical protein
MDRGLQNQGNQVRISVRVNLVIAGCSCTKKNLKIRGQISFAESAGAPTALATVGD